MNPAEMRRLLTQFEDEHREVEDQVVRLALRNGGLVQAISGLRALLAAAGEEVDHREVRGADAAIVEESAKADILDDGDHPRGADAVRAVLQDEGREMTVRQITEALLTKGWGPRSKNPENATSSNAARAAEVYAEITRRRGPEGLVYKYVPPDEAGVTNVTSFVRRVESPVEPSPSWPNSPVEDILGREVTTP